MSGQQGPSRRPAAALSSSLHAPRPPSSLPAVSPRAQPAPAMMNRPASDSLSRWACQDGQEFQNLGCGGCCILATSSALNKPSSSSSGEGSGGSLVAPTGTPLPWRPHQSKLGPAHQGTPDAAIQPRRYGKKSQHALGRQHCARQVPAAADGSCGHLARAVRTRQQCCRGPGTQAWAIKPDIRISGYQACSPSQICGAHL